MVHEGTAGVRLSLSLVLAGLLPYATGSAKEKADALPPCPARSLYEDYKPDFVDKELHEGGRRGPSRKLMELSSEPSFFTLNLLPESDRAYALAEAALARAKEGVYGEALDIFHRIIEEYPDELYRASPYGVGTRTWSIAVRS